MKSDPDILITHEYPPFFGGVATYCVEVASAARRMGRNLSVWVPGETITTDLPAVIRLGGRVSLQAGPLFHFGREIYARKSLWQGKRVYLASLGAHWVFSHLWRAGLVGKVRLIPIFHGSEILRYERSFWFRSFTRNWLASCERLLAASPYSLERVQSSFLCPPEKPVELAPCGVRHDLLLSAARLREEIGSEGLTRPWKVLTLARLHPRKGQAEVIRALGRLPEALRQQVIYQLAGTGDPGYQAELQSLASENGVVVEWLGAVPNEQLAAVYAGCDLYVMTSRSMPRSIEGFGMTYLEAGLFAKPVIGYRAGGVSGAVRDGETGLLVEEGQVTELSGAIARLLSDPSLRRSLGLRGREIARASTWERTVEALFGC